VEAEDDQQSRGQQARDACCVTRTRFMVAQVGHWTSLIQVGLDRSFDIRQRAP
jgi:hypothetical protein